MTKTPHDTTLDEIVTINLKTFIPGPAIVTRVDGVYIVTGVRASGEPSHKPIVPMRIYKHNGFWHLESNGLMVSRHSTLRYARYAASRVDAWERNKASIDADTQEES